jgi:hypothetical protein
LGLLWANADEFTKRYMRVCDVTIVAYGESDSASGSSHALAACFSRPTFADAHEDMQKKLFLIANLIIGCVSVRATPPARQADVPFIVAPADELKAIIPRTLRSTHPDFVVFVPSIENPDVNQTGNEHFLVFDGPDDSLMAVWTQSTREGQPDQHIVFARSDDEGATWSRPRIIAGPNKAGEGNIASWAFPLVSKAGRIYVIYSQHVGKFDTFFHTTGQMTGIFSDDNGTNWSKPEVVPVPRTKRDNPDESYPANWICWQKPTRIASDGKYLGGITRWTSKGVFKNPGKSWTSHDSVVEFMRFENVDENPMPGKMLVTLLTPDDHAVILVRFPGLKRRALLGSEMRHQSKVLPYTS